MQQYLTPQNLIFNCFIKDNSIAVMIPCYLINLKYEKGPIDKIVRIPLRFPRFNVLNIVGVETLLRQ